MKTLRVGLLLLGLAALTGCSQHWRDADPGADIGQVESWLAESLEVVTSQAVGNSAGEGARFQEILDDDFTTIYFAKSSPEMGEPKNVVPFLDWQFLGSQLVPQSGGEDFSDQINEARVFFLDLAYEGGSSENALLFDLKVGDHRVVKIFFNDPSAPAFYENGEFVSQMISSDGAQIVIRSFDVDGDVLQSVIQLEVYNGTLVDEESYAGKITTLVGFGPQ